jgi:hypothetical protein
MNHAQQYVRLPIFVVGSGRSGTTWIGGTIASCARCLPVSEPLHLEHAIGTPHWEMPGAYLREGDSYPKWEAFFDALLAGRISNARTRADWTRVPKLLTRWSLAERIGYRLAKIQYQYRRMLGSRYVIREVRANLMLEWLAKYTRARVVFLIRHPCAVIGSRMRRPNRDWEVDMEEILRQSQLMRDFLEPFRSTISEAVTPLKRQAVLWCIENFVPLSQAGSTDWLLHCYEEFVADEDDAFNTIFRRLGLEPSPRTQKVKNRVVSDPTYDLNTPRRWHDPLSETEGELVLRICEEFRLTLYGRRSAPLCTPRELVDSAFVNGTPPERPSGSVNS